MANEEIKMKTETHEWLNMTRLAGKIQRIHVYPTNTTDYISRHSNNVAIICYWLSPNSCDSEILLAALFHDLSEFETGDIPANAKWEHPELKEILLKITNKFEDEWELKIEISDNQKVILKLADSLEFLLTSIEELEHGNRHMLEPLRRSFYSIGEQAKRYEGTMMQPAFEKAANFLVYREVSKYL